MGSSIELSLTQQESVLAGLVTRFTWARKGALAVVDQALFAGTHFLINIVLARYLSKSEYGIFAVAYSLFLLLLSLHSALFAEPMMVFGAGKYAQKFEEYLRHLLCGHFLLMLPGALLLSALAALIGRFYSVRLGQALTGVALSLPFLTLLWLLRRALYVRTRIGHAAMGSLLYLAVLSTLAYLMRPGSALSFLGALAVLGIAGSIGGAALAQSVFRRRVAVGWLSCLLSLVVVTWWLWRRVHLSPMIVFLAMGVGAFAVCGFMLVCLKLSWNSPSKTIAAGAVETDHWKYGRWALPSAVVTWAPTNLYYVLLMPWIGLEGTGSLRALMNLAMPMLNILYAMSPVLLPRLVRDRHSGGVSAMTKTMKLYFVVVLPLCGLYLGVLWLCHVPLLKFLYGGRYELHSAVSLILLGFVGVGASLVLVLESALRALEHPDWLFWCYLASTAAAVAVGIPLAATSGVSGALAGIVMSSLIGSALMYTFYRHVCGGATCGAMHVAARTDA